MFKKKRLVARDTQNIRSRISWGAVFAGFFVALVTLVVLTTFGTAARLTVLGSDIQDPQSLTIGAVVYQSLSAFVSLFMGGWATSRFMARETKAEAGCTGLVLWGMCFMALLVLTVNGITLSLSAIMGVNMIFSNYISALELRHMAQAMELTADQYTTLQEMVRDSLRETHVVSMTWWAFAGLLLSILATVGGSLAGHRPGPLKAEAKATQDGSRARVSHLTRVKI